jgi:hypothetical protein
LDLEENHRNFIPPQTTRKHLLIQEQGNEQVASQRRDRYSEGEFAEQIKHHPFPNRDADIFIQRFLGHVTQYSKAAGMAGPPPGI